jgi:hypothetical protein
MTVAAHDDVDRWPPGADIENEVLLIRGFIQHVTLPLILNSTPAPIILGTATIFRIEGRTFIVTAAHTLKSDPDDPYSGDILAGA